MLKILRAINPYTWYKAWKTSRLMKERLSVSEFAHKHKHLVVIILDPEEDTMFMAYHDKQVLNKIKTADGQNHRIVKGVMKAGQFKSKIDFFLVAILEILKVPLTNPYMQHFIKWLDGAVFSIGQALRKDKHNEEFAQFIDKEKQKKFGVKDIAEGLKGRVGPGMDIRVGGKKV